MCLFQRGTVLERIQVNLGRIYPIILCLLLQPQASNILEIAECRAARLFPVMTRGHRPTFRMCLLLFQQVQLQRLILICLCVSFSFRYPFVSVFLIFFSLFAQAQSLLSNRKFLFRLNCNCLVLDNCVRTSNLSSAHFKFLFYSRQ